MNIIVEGIDKAGKSTIVNDIRESLFPKIPVVLKVSKRPVDSSDLESQMIVERYREIFAQTENPLNKDHIFLFDRSYPSEMVYSFKRGKDRLYDKEFIKIDDDLADHNRTLLIYCEATPEVIEKRFRTEKEDYATPEDISKIFQRYETFLENTALPYLRINSLTDRGANIVAVRKFLLI